VLNKIKKKINIFQRAKNGGSESNHGEIELKSNVMKIKFFREFKKENSDKENDKG
jgi:hypothetical protein